jgi:hypothetical protein
MVELRKREFLIQISRVKEKDNKISIGGKGDSTTISLRKEDWKGTLPELRDFIRQCLIEKR